MSPIPGHDAGSAIGGGAHLDIGHLLKFALIGAVAGAFIPVIPGGPAGGVLIGAALSLVI